MQIAKNGLGTTYPNPSVGAVIVVNNLIIGEGFTSSYGGNHAEVNAINSVLDKTLLKEATLYVTLEPCAHYGKTPPCTDLIIKYRIKRVVIGCIDTNILVAGKGVKRLEASGCKVIVGVLEKECLAHHKRFFTVQNKKRPYIILKWATTKDGFIAPDFKNLEKQKPVWISNQYSQQLVHKWRSKEHAILVGTNTAITDNPKLNLRSWSGMNPIRVVLDRNLRIPSNANLLDKKTETIIITESKNNSLKNHKKCIYESIDFSKNVASQICQVLQKHKIQSIIIEGGTQLLQTFINANLWDEARVFTGNKFFKKGLKAPKFENPFLLYSSLESEKNIKKDILKRYIND